MNDDNEKYLEALLTPTSKTWYTSKTLWINTILFLISVLGLFAAHPLFLEYAAHILLVSSVLNLALRYFFTETSLNP
jgi:hypothetical protein